MKTRRAQQGQAIILIVLAIVGMVGLVALAVDGGNAFADRRHAQSAADAAALAAALASASGGTTEAINNAALGIALDNGYGYQITEVNNPPQAGCGGQTNIYIGNDEYFQVIIHSEVDTYFARVLGVERLQNCVEAIARGTPAHTEPMYFGNAMVSLNPHDCRAVEVGGDTDATLLGGGLFVNSDSTCAQGALRTNGNPDFTAPSACANGTAIINLGNPMSGFYPLPTACPTHYDYPPTNIIFPTVSCTTNGTRSNGALTPGSMPASWLSGDVTLAPGVYCLSGSVTINGHDSIAGDGILLYFIDGSMHINGDADIHISAATTGDYAGLLIYQPLSNSTNMILNGTADTVFSGSILAPAADIQLNGTMDLNTFDSQIIGYTLDLSGTFEGTIRYDDNQNYDATVPPTVEIIK